MSIKELREMTGAGLMDCKKALEDAQNDIQKAIEILKAKGIAKALKRSGNAANEGAIMIVESDKNCVMLSVGTETDFVAKNDNFCSSILKEAQNFAQNDAQSIETDEFKEGIAILSSKFGENIVLNDSFKVEKNVQNKIITYIHSNLNANFLNIGKIGVVLIINSDANSEIAKNIALHIASFKPSNLEELNSQDYLMDTKFTIAKLCNTNNIKIINFKVFAI